MPKDNFQCAHDELIELHKLQPNPKNPNKHPEKQISMLAKIIDYQGQRAPIVVSKRSGFITKGHGRLMAIEKLGWTKAAVDFQEYDDEAQEFADMVADNKIAELAEHDDEMFKIEALNLELDVNGFDLDLLGIPDLDLSTPDEAKEAIEDDVQEVTESISKLGDLYELGEHRLLCGDSTDKDTVERLMNGEKADMVFTDPPYGMNLQTDYSSMHKQVKDGSTSKAKVGTKGSRWKPIENDDKPFNPSHIFDFFGYCKEIFIWGGDYFYQHLPIDGTFLVWDKNNGNEGADKMIGNGYEMCWTKIKHKKTICRIFGRGTFGHDKVKIHPTQKPVQLAEWFFERWGLSKVVDLYGGSGSTLIACEKTKRKCFMMELDPHYVDVIVTRWCKYTGKTKVKRNGAEIDWVIG